VSGRAAREMTGRAAVYRLYDASDVLLYVGATSEPGRRFRVHKAITPWWNEVAHHTLEWHDSMQEALTAETVVIGAETPLYNMYKAPWRAMIQHSFRMSDEFWERIQRAAEQLGMTASEFIRQAAEEKAGQIERQEK
jgi:predicted GIY-YIG superfamily endonuclease